VVTRFGDWAAMILAVVGVLGCVATVGIVIASRMASTAGTIKALRVAVTGGQLAAAERAGSRSARPVALLGAASMCLTSTWLSGDALEVVTSAALGLAGQEVERIDLAAAAGPVGVVRLRGGRGVQVRDTDTGPDRCGRGYERGSGGGGVAGGVLGGDHGCCLFHPWEGWGVHLLGQVVETWASDRADQESCLAFLARHLLATARRASRTLGPSRWSPFHPTRPAPRGRCRCHLPPGRSGPGTP